MLKRLFCKAVARYYLGRPEVAGQIEARYQSWASLLYSVLNFLTYELRSNRVFRLTTAMIEPTNRCNLKCEMCPVNRSMKRERGFMDIALFRKIVDQNPDLEYILLFNWGEPFLHPQLFDMIDYAALHKVRTYVTTNGTLLDEETVARVVASPLDRITISIDGIGEVYERIRHADYHQVEENVRRLIDRRKAQRSPLKIDLAINVFELNEPHVEAFRSRWQGAVDRLQIQPRVYVGEHVAPGNLKRTQRCDEVWRGNLVVLWDGTVVPCCVDVEGALPVGNANTQRLKDIVNGDRMRRLRANLNRNCFLGVCAECLEYQTPIVGPRFRSNSPPESVLPPARPL